jgi:hypothetical protein
MFAAQKLLNIAHFQHISGAPRPFESNDFCFKYEQN